MLLCLLVISFSWWLGPISLPNSFDGLVDFFLCLYCHWCCCYYWRVSSVGRIWPGGPAACRSSRVAACSQRPPSSACPCKSECAGCPRGQPCCGKYWGYSYGVPSHPPIALALPPQRCRTYAARTSPFNWIGMLYTVTLIRLVPLYLGWSRKCLVETLLSASSSDGSRTSQGTKLLQHKYRHWIPAGGFLSLLFFAFKLCAYAKLNYLK